MDFGQIAIIAIVVVPGLTILQFVLKSLGRLARWLISVAAVGICVYLLWKGGAFEWVDSQLDLLSAHSTL